MINLCIVDKLAALYVYKVLSFLHVFHKLFHLLDHHAVFKRTAGPFLTSQFLWVEGYCLGALDAMLPL